MVLADFSGMLEVFDAESGALIACAATPLRPHRISMTGERLRVDHGVWRLSL